ncbi:MAG: cupin domain-containing protein [Pikeienuella sp.]|uniref:cupin domain-containing protein n=1 Tax=Pikeienuella sp. TaxID=2831957 RepID=UPI00391C8650
MTSVAEIRLPTADLHQDLPFFETLGFRLDLIHPADDPAVAVISGHGLRIRLQRGAAEAPGTIRILTDDPALAGGVRALLSPSGHRIEIAPPGEELPAPKAEPAFLVQRLSDGAPWVIGRAGMHYRDLAPGRLGGAFIASHIRIPEGGPVPDMVHFHEVGFQLIFCHAGWVDLVYEDQGPPFRLHAGDCVIQPPRIRHRVLHASDMLEVVEIGAPADHVTRIDHAMTLPTEAHRPERVFDGQVFLLHREAGAEWRPAARPGFIHRDTGVARATGGVAAVHVLRPTGEGEAAPLASEADIHFTFLRAGSMRLEAAGQAPRLLEAGDAFTTPPGLATTYAAPSADLELLEVTMPRA